MKKVVQETTSSEENMEAHVKNTTRETKQLRGSIKPRNKEENFQPMSEKIDDLRKQEQKQLKLKMFEDGLTSQVSINQQKESRTAKSQKKLMIEKNKEQVKNHQNCSLNINKQKTLDNQASEGKIGSQKLKFDLCEQKAFIQFATKKYEETRSEDYKKFVNWFKLKITQKSPTELQERQQQEFRQMLKKEVFEFCQYNFYLSLARQQPENKNSKVDFTSYKNFLCFMTKVEQEQHEEGNFQCSKNQTKESKIQEYQGKTGSQKLKLTIK